MLELGQPAWLFGPALLPVVYWLHRRAPTVHARPVSAVFLWPGEHPDQPEQRRARSVDRRWRLRAAVVALLLMALAGPRWIGAPSRHITVWFDNAPSMQAVENTVARRQLAPEELADALRHAGAATIVVRTLQNPERRLAWSNAAELQAWLEAPSRTAHLPDPRVHAEDGENWLVTDAVHPELARWIEQGAPTRVIAVGRETRNTALTRLALRAMPGAPDKFAGLVGVAQHGDAPVTRTVTLHHGASPIATLQVQLAPDRESTATFVLPGPLSQPLRATVAGADALPQDDALVLDAAAIRPLPTFITAACPPHIFKALALHPALVPVAAADGALTVACAATAPDYAGPTLWLITGATPRPVTGDVRWQAAPPLSELLLDDLALRQAIVPAPLDGAPLLLSANEPLITLRAAPPARVAVALDVTSAAWAHRPELPILLAGLVDTLFGQPLLERYAHAAIPFDATRIAPQPLPPAAAAPPPRAGAARLDLTPHLIALAMLLLLADAQWRRLGGARLRRKLTLAGAPGRA